MFAVGCLTGIQLFAWYTGHNGVVFATISGIIAGVSGALLGFKIGRGGN